MTQQSLYYLFILCFNLLLATSCGPTTVSTQDNCTPACDSWESCLNGQCVQSCMNDVECGSNSFCINSMCSAIVPCQSTGQCDTGSSCLNGFCIPVNRQCGNVAACTVGDCINGICTTGENNNTNSNQQCSSDSECPTGQSCISGFCQDNQSDQNNNNDVNNNNDENDDCEGREDGQLGDSCDGASDCCNGLCLGDPNTGQGFCTAQCASYDDCNPVGFNHDMLCVDTGTDGSLCAFSDYSDTCESTNDCIGQICLVSASESACSLACNSGALCPPGSACGFVYADTGTTTPNLIQVCATIGSSCAVTSDCLTGTCLTDSETGIGYCSIFCTATDATSCPSNYTCSPIAGSDMPVCVRN